MSQLFSPIALSSPQGPLHLANRIVIAPMCQYACDLDGKANDWHLMHWGNLLNSGAGLLIIAEGITSAGRPNRPLNSGTRIGRAFVLYAALPVLSSYVAIIFKSHVQKDEEEPAKASSTRARVTNDEDEEVDEKMGMNSNEVSIPFKLSFNTLLIKNIINKL